MLLQKNNISHEDLVFSENTKTTVKTRVIAQNQQIVRIDEEDSNDINSDDEKKSFLISIKFFLTKNPMYSFLKITTRGLSPKTSLMK